MKKFSSLLVVLLLMSVSFSAHAQGYPRGDVDRDGSVNISDVTCLIDNLLNGISEGDVDQDGAVNISDATCLIDYLLSGSWTDDPMPPTHEGDWVDLGLPSGTLWATCNVGATAPEEYGDYFAWGETEPKEEYTWENYKWCYYDDNGNLCITKYHNYDDMQVLDIWDDAAFVHWGVSWRMPTYDQMYELDIYCTWQVTQRNNVDGVLGTGPNGNAIFLPFAGYRQYSSLDGEGTVGNYWSCTVHRANNPSYTSGSGYTLICRNDDSAGDYIVEFLYYLLLPRFVGFPVRAVHV